MIDGYRKGKCGVLFTVTLTCGRLLLLFLCVCVCVCHSVCATVRGDPSFDRLAVVSSSRRNDV